jgi:hypothetical protein
MCGMVQPRGGHHLSGSSMMSGVTNSSRLAAANINNRLTGTFDPTRSHSTSAWMAGTNCNLIFRDESGLAT